MNQGHIRPGYEAFSQGVTLTHAGVMQSSSSLYVSRPPASATPLPAGDMGPVPHYRHDQKPYARPLVGATVNQEVRKVGVQQQISAQGSIVRGTPVVSGQQPYANYADKKNAGSVLSTAQEGHVDSQQQLRQASLELAEATGSPCVQPNPMQEMSRISFMRNQHDSLRHFLNYWAEDATCPHVCRDKNAPHKVYVNMVANDNWHYQALGPHLLYLLRSEADNTDYPFIIWCTDRVNVQVNVFAIQHYYPGRF